jgi:hypothetical protein
MGGSQDFSEPGGGKMSAIRGAHRPWRGHWSNRPHLPDPDAPGLAVSRDDWFHRGPSSSGTTDLLRLVELVKRRRDEERSRADFARQIQELRSWCERRIETAIDDLRRELRPARESVSRPSADPVSAWMRSHQEELLQYRGQRIAVHPERGVIASGPDLGSVYARVRELGLLDEVVFDTVPNE